MLSFLRIRALQALILAVVLPVFPFGRQAGRVAGAESAGSPHPELIRLLESQKPISSGRRYLRRRMNNNGSVHFAGMAVPERESPSALTGTLIIPVITLLYDDTPYIPLPAGLLQRELFSGPWETGTMSEYFNEVSRGIFGVNGDVRDWIRIAEDEAYYSGGFGNWGIDLEASRTGELISEAVMISDPAIDFGMYDNDGPDQVPNSGDDDGYVDILFLVTPTMGAECDFFSAHYYTHSGSFSTLWSNDGQPLSTSDPSAAGGYIKVDDYIIAPSISCSPFGTSAGAEKIYRPESSGRDTLIEIGTFCHELGHALGLPDLYDTDLSKGIGYWGLMGFGELNTPESPAHPSAYSKEKLGWIEVIDIYSKEQEIKLRPVISSGRAVRLAVPDIRFRRVSCSSGYALACGLNSSESAERGWPAGAGYGNMWREKVGRGFRSSGTGSCIIDFVVSTDTDSGDFGCLLIGNSGITDTLAAWSGLISDMSESIDVTSYLSSPDDSFFVSFCFISDYSTSDEDGDYDSEWCRSFRVDDISITGKGIDYYCDFEDGDGGWKYMSAGSEYFLAEYRTRSGFDRHLPQEGLLIWHVDDPLARSTLGNSGGSANRSARGVVLEEADGRFDLLNGSFGEPSDPYPGTGGNDSFSASTAPGSVSNSGYTNQISITGISKGSDGEGSFIEAAYRGTAADSTGDEQVEGIIGFVDVQPGTSAISIEWSIIGESPYRSLIYRKTEGEGWFRLITADTLRNRDGIFRYRDYYVQQGEQYTYRLEAFSGTEGESLNIGGRYSLYDYNITGIRTGFAGSYPNPFSDEVTLTFHLSENPVAKITIFDVKGRKIDTVGPAVYREGYNSIRYTPPSDRFSSGVYFCLLESNGRRDVIKIVLIR